MRLSGSSARAVQGFVRAHVCPLPLPAISHALKSTKPGATVSQRPVRLRISSEIGGGVEVAADNRRK
jgi:hypothetical protein